MKKVSFDDKYYELNEEYAKERASMKVEDIERQSAGSESETTAKKTDTSYLDGLRGVAALTVFTYHFLGGGDHEHGFGENGHYYFISLPFVRMFYSSGGAAVSIFFVLSGFVLSQSSLKFVQNKQFEKCRQGLISSVVKRPFRLYLPCFAVSFIVAVLMQLPNNFYPALPWSTPKDNLGAELPHWFERTLVFFNPFREHGPHLEWYQYCIAMWTIPLELKGSMLVYGILAIICLTGIALQIWTPAILALVVVSLLYFAKWTAGCFVAGLVLALIELGDLDARICFQHISMRAALIVVHMIFFLGFYLMTEPAMDGHLEVSRETPGWYFLTQIIPSRYPEAEYYRFWNSYGAILFVYSTLRIRWLQALFTTKPIRYLGKVSFMFYLVHQPLMYVVGDRFKRAFGQIMPYSETKWWDNMLYVPDVGPRGLSLRWAIDWTIMLAVILPVAHLATRFIDRPSVTLGKKVCQSLGLDRR